MPNDLNLSMYIAVDRRLAIYNHYITIHTDNTYPTTWLPLIESNLVMSLHLMYSECKYVLILCTGASTLLVGYLPVTLCHCSIFLPFL